MPARNLTYRPAAQSPAAARPSSDGGWRVVFPPAAGTHNLRSRETTRVTPFAHLHIGSFANYSLFTIHYSLGLSVDPMSGKYPSLSPYVYCADNPVKLVDPNGENLWYPNEDGDLVSEEGDNANTLASYLNISTESAQNMMSEQQLAMTNGFVESGQTLKLDNVYTRSITYAKTKPQYFYPNGAGVPQQVVDELKKGVYTYNCWGSCMNGTRGLEIVPGCGIGVGQTFDEKLKESYIPIGRRDAVFGKTIIRFVDSKGVINMYGETQGFPPEGTAPYYSGFFLIK